MKKINIKKLKKIPIKKKKIQTKLRIAAIAILSIIVIASAYSAYAAFQQPTTTEKNVISCEYNHNGKFDYIVYLKNNTIYNNISILYPGQETIFRKITDHINASLTFRFLCDQPANIDGNYELIAQLQTDIWTKEYVIVPQTAFSSNGNSAHFTTSFPINYTHFENIVNQIDQEIGVNAGDPTLHMKCNIDITAEINNGSISESFTPSSSCPNSCSLSKARNFISVILFSR